MGVDDLLHKSAELSHVLDLAVQQQESPTGGGIVVRPGKDTPDGLLLPPRVLQKRLCMCVMGWGINLTYVFVSFKVEPSDRILYIFTICLKMIPNCAIVFQTVKADNW